MNLTQTRLHILDKMKDLGKEAKSGVSLHCHTEHSKEMLDFVPHYAAKIPVVSYFWEKERESYFESEGKELNFSTGYWSPPFTGREVYCLEKEQINGMGLEAVVSITDHDCIDANLQMGEQNNHAQTPISMEWTVPFRYAFLHIGVHNLPPERAVEITEQLLDYTFSKESPNNEKLNEIFALLNEIPEVLIVLNHPLWDIEMVGNERHIALLKTFIKEHGNRIHALEINGFRSWSENKAVMELAEFLNIPLVSGGDRHCGKPNTVINITNAETFAEFAEEVRVYKQSEVVIMPEYRQPLHSRQLQSIAEIIKYYPAFPEDRRRWVDRVHFDIADGSGIQPLAVHWKNGGPPWLRWAMWTIGILAHKSMRPAFRLAMKREDRVPKQIITDKPHSTVIVEPLTTNAH
jgi:hypothetical protein